MQLGQIAISIWCPFFTLPVSALLFWRAVSYQASCSEARSNPKTTVSPGGFYGADVLRPVVWQRQISLWRMCARNKIKTSLSLRPQDSGWRKPSRRLRGCQRAHSSPQSAFTNSTKPCGVMASYCLPSQKRGLMVPCSISLAPSTIINGIFSS